MNKIYFLIITTFFALSISAQDLYLINPNLVINTTDVNATDLNVQTYLVNNSGTAITVEYSYNDGNLVTYDWPDQAVGFCNDATCDDPSITVNGSFTMGIGDSVNIKLTVAPEGISDSIGGNLRFSVPGTMIPRVAGTYSIKVASDVVSSIKDFDNTTLSIYPNPATNFIQIEGVEDINTIDNIDIYSIIGKKILSTSISSKADLKLNIQNLDNGVYLVKLFNDKKNVFYTKTFVKK